jgi:hypothetical protein
VDENRRGQDNSAANGIAWTKELRMDNNILEWNNENQFSQSALVLWQFKKINNFAEYQELTGLDKNSKCRKYGGD